MKAEGLFVFKTLTHRPAGKFTTAEGKEQEYKSAYILKVDEIGEDNSINERKFKIEEDKAILINALRELQAYQQINIIFNVRLYSSGATIEVSDVEVVTKDEDY